MNRFCNCKQVMKQDGPIIKQDCKSSCSSIFPKCDIDDTAKYTLKVNHNILNISTDKSDNICITIQISLKNLTGKPLHKLSIKDTSLLGTFDFALDEIKIFQPDIVATTSYTPEVYRACKLLKKVKSMKYLISYRFIWPIAL